MGTSVPLWWHRCFWDSLSGIYGAPMKWRSLFAAKGTGASSSQSAPSELSPAAAMLDVVQTGRYLMKPRAGT